MDILELSLQVNNQLKDNHSDLVDNRQTSTINPRLIRHYSSIGLLTSPTKLGKAAVYNENHIWEIIFIKKMLNERFGLDSIKKILDDLKNNNSNYTEKLKESLNESNEPAKEQTRNGALDFLNGLSNNNSTQLFSASAQAFSSTSKSNLIGAMRQTMPTLLDDAIKNKSFYTERPKQITEYQVRDYLKVSIEKPNTLEKGSINQILNDIKIILQGEAK